MERARYCQIQVYMILMLANLSKRLRDDTRLKRDFSNGSFFCVLPLMIFTTKFNWIILWGTLNLLNTSVYGFCLVLECVIVFIVLYSLRDQFLAENFWFSKILKLLFDNLAVHINPIRWSKIWIILKITDGIGYLPLIVSYSARTTAKQTQVG